LSISARTIGVVIRTLNESELIGRCLETLQSQRGSFDLDVVVVDSGSTDNTIDIAQSRGARIVKVAPSDFDYSKALNLGIEHVRGEIVVSISAHAIPIDDGWLERMTAPFEGKRVAGVSSRQVPWPNAPWQEVKRLSQQFSKARAVYAAGDRGGDVVFSNGASAVRRSVWREHPFTLPAVEDLEWAERVIRLGWTIVYEPGAAVYHSHEEPPRAQARRMIDINRVHPRGRHARLRTLREAGGLFVRDARWILGLDEPLRRRVGHLFNLVLVVFYYVVDFSKAGTTAERRRADRTHTIGEH
jgi:rhamnosyltransferase